MKRINESAILEALREGRSFGDVAALCGVDRGSVRKVAKRAGHKAPESARSPALAARAKARLAEMIVARDEAYLRAMREKVQPVKPARGRPKEQVFSLVGASEDLCLYARTPADLPAEWPEVRAWRAARDRVFKENIALFAWLGQKAGGRSEDFGDLAEGFLRAIDLWSPAKGCNLSTYASRWVLSFALIAHKRRAAEATGRGGAAG